MLYPIRLGLESVHLDIKMMTYQGSQLLSFLGDKIGLPIDRLNFIIVQLVAIVSGLLYRAYLKPCPENTLKRHLVNLLWGIALGHFCFGGQMWHLYVQVFLCYLALVTCPRKYSHLVIFVTSMGYLSGMHIHRLLYDYGNYTLDITGAMMVLTQKLTSLGFAYYDGARNPESLTPDQRTQVIEECPHIIEFLSYTFNFQGIIVGPLCYYRDYIDFVTGNNILKHKNPNAQDESESKIVQPSVTVPLIKKLLSTVVLGIIFFKVSMVYSCESNMDPEVTSQSFWFRLVYFYVSTGSQRVKYYIAWMLADAVNNASGLGFNGYDSNGNAKWDLVTNIDIIGLELSTSVKTSFDRWNIQTQLWLRRIAYDRLATGKTLGVFVLSAFWHGFYPGYYLTFVLSAFLVYSGRGIRRKIRPYFQSNAALRVLYAVLTWFGTILPLDYAAYSFLVLEFWKAIEFYNAVFWVVHIAVIIIAVTLPGGSTKPKKKPE